MEDKKRLYLLIGVGAIVLFVGIVVIAFFFLQQKPAGPDLPPSGTVTNSNGNLPSTNGSGLPNSQDKTPAEIQLEKDKEFISSFFEPPQLFYTAQVKDYGLPVENIKEAVINYRDFSRRYDPVENLDTLSNNGFLVIDNPYDLPSEDWQSGFQALKDDGIPVFITSDAVAGIYQDTLDIVYKEIEPDRFYPSLWDFLRNLQRQTKDRYEFRRQQFGIETDPITEANRLELGYISVALKLLQPDESQVRETIGADRKYFSPQEAFEYNFQIPPYLEEQVLAEIDLISKHTNNTVRSPLFLFQQNYTKYEIPAEYQISEKLKNYYLATTWLQDKNFPLYSQADNCPGCLLDEQDHTIHFLAGLYLAKNIAENQDFKNSWANIYKSIAFFRGLESDLTYLDYHVAMQEIYGNDYDLDTIFQTDIDSIKAEIDKIQNGLKKFTFLDALGSRANLPAGPDLRLLRDYHRLENITFNRLTGDAVGNYIYSDSRIRDPLSPTACNTQGLTLRCYATALDIFSILGNQTATDIIAQNRDNRFENYDQNRQAIINDIAKFDQRTWHDNAYLSLLDGLRQLNPRGLNGFPAFMRTSAWDLKTVNTQAASWAITHRPIVLEKQSIDGYRGFEPFFPYGYIEPQPEFYAQLLATTRMVINGFTSLGIISESDRSYHRLVALANMLDRATEISIDELENKTLTPDDFDFINNFHKEIKAVTGDVLANQLSNEMHYQYPVEGNRYISEFVNGLKYMIVVYPNQDGELIIAMGPILNYTEGESGRPIKADWQIQLNL